MNTVILLLLTFILAVTALFVFIWSLRKHLFDDNPAAANVIFSEGEIGKVEEPAATADQHRALQSAVDATHTATVDPARDARMAQELAERVQADRSTAYVTFVFLARSEEHTSELQSLMRISYAVFCLKKQK